MDGRDDHETGSDNGRHLTGFLLPSQDTEKQRQQHNEQNEEAGHPGILPIGHARHPARMGR